jgi:hypothetical protein
MMERIPTQTGARDQLLSDLKTVIADAEAWLRQGQVREDPGQRQG